MMVEQGAEVRQTILVVDDESVIRKLVKDCLTGLSVDVSEAGNPEEALQLYRELVDEKKNKLDLVITDIRMPNPRQGIEMVHEMARLGYNGSVIIMSGTMGDLKETDIEVFLAQGIQVETLQKPASPLALIQIATRLLTKP